jgi:hypothetical protein
MDYLKGCLSHFGVGLGMWSSILKGWSTSLVLVMGNILGMLWYKSKVYLGERSVFPLRAYCIRHHISSDK